MTEVKLLEEKNHLQEDRPLDCVSECGNLWPNLQIEECASQKKPKESKAYTPNPMRHPEDSRTVTQRWLH